MAYSQLPFTCFIRNVAYDASEAEVKAVFRAQIGGVVRVYLAQGEPEGTHKGYGFVAFENEHYLRSALNDDGAILVRGRQIFIQPARPKPKPSALPEEKAAR
jgi:RNA recognition motif-containing protein